MNCQTFETFVSELARDQMLEASAREQAILHTRECEQCSLRLSEELKLTAQLRQLSADMRTAQMPQGAEETLLTEFRSISTRRFDSARFRWTYAYASAAAVLLIALVVVATRSSRPTPSTRVPTEVAVVQPQTGPVEAQKPAPRETQKVTPTTGAKPAVKRKTKPARSKDMKPLEAVAQTIPQAGGTTHTEIATEFIPVGYSSPAMLQDGGQVVRVELPRYAMARFGLPVNMDRYEEKVKADVLVGVDGLARAIRFVQ